LTLSPSARTIKSRLIKHKGYTEGEALAYLLDHKLITVKDAKIKSPPDGNPIPHAPDTSRQDKSSLPSTDDRGSPPLEVPEEFQKRVAMIAWAKSHYGVDVRLNEVIAFDKANYDQADDTRLVKAQSPDDLLLAIKPSRNLPPALSASTSTSAPSSSPTSSATDKSPT
jgi:hypothetical protein